MFDLLVIRENGFGENLREFERSLKKVETEMCYDAYVPVYTHIGS